MVILYKIIVSLMVNFINGYWIKSFYQFIRGILNLYIVSHDFLSLIEEWHVAISGTSKEDELSPNNFSSKEWSNKFCCQTDIL